MASAASIPKIWCDEERHRKYEDYADFNDWLDGDEGMATCAELELDGWARASKVLFVGDREAYDLTLETYRIARRDQWLARELLETVCGDDHWFDRNVRRFDQLCNRLEHGDVVPFIGAGLSQPGGFPTWKDHLGQQWRTARLANDELEALLAGGDYEGIIDRIERERSRDVFVQELRDAFDRNGTLPEALYLIAELFRDTLITTNYDHLIEQSFDIGDESAVEVVTPATILDPRNAAKVTVIKLHGDIRAPAGCILSKNQYDQAYGAGPIDLTLPIPQALDYYFRNSSLLFLGCSLNQDRTIRVFEAIKARAVADLAELPQHFAIEQCPGDEDKLAARNDYLLQLGVTPIWFPAGEFGFVPEILKLARDELLHRRP
jgi:NAD-dependent SIR2 family protein deacetylase